MADSKLTALTELTSVTADDLLYVVNDPSGTPVSRKCTVNTLLNGIAGSNLLINGGFEFFQRQTPGTATDRGDAAFGPDRWLVLRQSNNIDCERSTGDTNSRFAVKLTQKNASAQRIGLAQIVESFASVPQRSRSTRFQCRVKCSLSQAIRCAVLEWTGTADTSITRDVVNDWTSSDYTDGASKFFVDTNYTPLGNAAVTPSAATWTDLAVDVTPSSSCNNLVVFVWTEGTLAGTTNTLEICQGGLYDGTVARNWLPRPYAKELLLCQRYFEKTLPVDTAPADSTNVAAWIGTGLSVSANYVPVVYRGTKRVAPTVTYYSSARTASPPAGVWQYYNSGWSDGTSMSSFGSGTLGVTAIITKTSAFTTNNSYLVDGGLTADSEL